MNTNEQLYNKQSQIFSDTSEEHAKLAETWFDTSTADYWLHNRLYNAIDCITDAKVATWLTVGDGRWGLDSIRLKNRGVKNAFPTDICEDLLKASKERGLIESYSVENAEKLSFEDNSFDYVFCKESYHHFPRPYIALYEMLRVAKKAVFLVEPNDEPLVSTVGFKKFIKYKLKSFLARKGFGKLPDFYGSVRFPKDDYEESGNYKYGISVREAEKVAMGINLPQIVYKGFNSHYIKGCEFEPADIEKSAMFNDIVQTIEKQDRKCELGLLTYSGIMLGIYKESMDDTTKNKFSDKSWVVKDLPRNPYL